MGILKKYAALEKKYEAALEEIESLKRRLKTEPVTTISMDLNPGPKKITVKQTPLAEPVKWDFPGNIPQAVCSIFRANYSEVLGIVKENCKWGKIEVILELRKKYGFGLKEAKDLIDFLYEELSIDHLHIYIPKINNGDYFYVSDEVRSFYVGISLRANKLDVVKTFKEKYYLSTGESTMLYNFLTEGKLTKPPAGGQYR